MALSVLQDMIDEAPDLIAAGSTAINQIQEQIDKLNSEISAITDDICGVAQSFMTNYLTDTKIPELEIAFPQYGEPFSVVYGPTFGTIEYGVGNIYDFSILDSTANVIYQYLGINWDSDDNIILRVDDFDFANDYLTRPLDSGATYGLTPMRNIKSAAKSIVSTNIGKIENSIEIFERYV